MKTLINSNKNNAKITVFFIELFKIFNKKNWVFHFIFISVVLCFFQIVSAPTLLRTMWGEHLTPIVNVFSFISYCFTTFPVLWVVCIAISIYLVYFKLMKLSYKTILVIGLVFVSVDLVLLVVPFFLYTFFYGLHGHRINLP